MKFIVDAQLPKRLCDLLTQLGADCIHTLDLPEKNKTPDKSILELCDTENRIVITKDSDFLQSHLLFNRPQKLLLVNTGNIHNDLLLNLFQQHYSFMIKQFEFKHLITMNKEEFIIHE